MKGDIRNLVLWVMLCYTVGLQWLFGLYFGLALFVEEVLVILLQPSCKFVKHENPPGVGLLLACSLVNSCFWFYVFFCKFMSTTYQPCTFFTGTCSVTVTAGVVPQVYFCEKFLEYVIRGLLSQTLIPWRVILSTPKPSANQFSIFLAMNVGEVGFAQPMSR